MIFHNLIGQADLIPIMGAVAAGTTDTQYATEVNLLGVFEDVVFVATLGAVSATAVAILRARCSATAGAEGTTGTVNCLLDPNNSSALAAATATTGDSNKILVLEAYRPPFQYLKAEINRATANVAIVSMIAILLPARQGPYSLTNVATGAATANPGYFGLLQDGAYVVANPTLSLT